MDRRDVYIELKVIRFMVSISNDWQKLNKQDASSKNEKARTNYTREER